MKNKAESQKLKNDRKNKELKNSYHLPALPER